MPRNDQIATAAPVTGFLRNGIVLVAGLVCSATTVFAADVVRPPSNDLNTIVVTGRRLSVPDSEVKGQVETAMRSDPFFPTNM